MKENNPRRRKKMIGLEDRPKSEKQRKKIKMIVYRMMIKKKVNKSGKTQERGSILVELNLSPQITLEENLKPRLQMNA